MSITKLLLVGLSSLVLISQCVKKQEKDIGIIKQKPISSSSANQLAETVTDADGNVYRTIKIGNQLWTVENLRTTKYNDGITIPHITDDIKWRSLSTPGYCYYGNTTDNTMIIKYGALYNWYAVNTHKLSPEGWHVPTISDWIILQNYLIAHGFNWDGPNEDTNRIAKSMAAGTDWKTDDENLHTPLTDQDCIGNDLSKNNKSGFTALPGGARYADEKTIEAFSSSFVNLGYDAFWWSATETAGTIVPNSAANLCRLSNFARHFYSADMDEKGAGHSVRLLKN
jgi:uncharacterized protein (TIGR02145 family)